jgi:Rrf2 family protein
MLLLSAEPAGRWLSVATISTRMAIPVRFLPRVMTELARGGLVEARLGRTGGYRLARPPERISLLDVIHAVEPEDQPRTCVLLGIPCETGGRCAVHDTFTGARQALLDRLGDTTLADVTAADR